MMWVDDLYCLSSLTLDAYNFQILKPKSMYSNIRKILMCNAKKLTMLEKQ